MAKLQIKAGTTSKSVGIFIEDSSGSLGAGLNGLAFNTSGLIAYWYQPRITAPAAITLATLSSNTAAYSSGGFKQEDATHTPGHYRFDIPDACLTGATSVIIVLSGAANMAQVQLEIELTATDNQDATRGGMTALPNANAAATGGLVVIGTTANTFKSDGSANVTYANSAPPTVGAIATAVWQDTTAGDFTASGSIGKSIMNGVALGTGLTINAYTGNTPQTGDSFTRIGANGGGLTSLAAAGTALSTAQWSNALATNLGTLAGHDPGATLGTSTLTQAQVNGGAFANPLVNTTGTAQAGAATAITLASGASATDNWYRYLLIKIQSGTGAGQRRVITGYVGSTKVATVNSAWLVNPDNTSVYVIFDITGAVTGQMSALLGVP